VHDVSLAAGTRPGPYEIVAEIGAGRLTGRPVYCGAQQVEANIWRVKRLKLVKTRAQ